MIFNKQLSIPYYIDPLMRNGRDTRVQCHVDVPQKTSDRQIASAWLWRTKQVSGIIKKYIYLYLICITTIFALYP